MNDEVAAAVGTLIVRVAAGDQCAFAQLYDRTVGDVLAIALSVTRDPVHAHEVTREIYLEVWRTAPRGDLHRYSGHLLLQMARRRAIDRVRTLQTDRERDHQHTAVTQSIPDDDDVEHVETTLTYTRVADAIHTLPLLHRDVLSLAYTRGFTHAQIADALDIPLGVVMSRLRSSIEYLRARVDHRDADLGVQPATSH